MEAIILAGGQGTRLKEVLPDTAKPMAPIHDHPFLEYQLNYWIAAGVQRFILSVGYKAEQFLEYFGDRFGSADIAYAIERKPLGTGGGLKMAASLLKEKSPCLVLNGDTYFDVDLNVLSNFHRTRRAELTMTLRTMEHGKRYDGVELDGTKRVRSFKTARDSDDKKLINGGVYLVNPDILQNMRKATQPLSFEQEVLTQLVADERRVFGLEHEGLFIDIGIPADYRRASELLNPTLLSVRRIKNAS